MANTDHADALRSVQSIIEREFKPRPGAADMIAPNGKAYLVIRTKPAGTVVQALQDLGTRLRALIGEYQGDTVWWRRKPELDQDDKTKFWTARASLALGWARDERTEFMPRDASHAAYPGDGHEAGAAVPGQSRLYRKKPVVVAAVQLTGFDDMKAIGDHFGTFNNWHFTDQGVVIVTREGSMLAGIGDWIIKGVAGEFYPCKPDIFAASYEPVP